MASPREQQVDTVKIKQCLDYDPNTGIFKWKADRPLDHFKSLSAYRVWKTRFSGKVAGYKQEGLNTHYVTIRVFNKLYLAHRLAWLFYYDVWPSHEVDHLDGDGLNNSIENLRDVPKYINGRNSARKKNNTSGVNGVYWSKSVSKWCAEGHFTEDGINKKKYIGVFENLEDAKEARIAWERSVGEFTERHGT